MFPQSCLHNLTFELNRQDYYLLACALADELRFNFLLHWLWMILGLFFDNLLRFVFRRLLLFLFKMSQVLLASASGLATAFNRWHWLILCLSFFQLARRRDFSWRLAHDLRDQISLQLLRCFNFLLDLILLAGVWLLSRWRTCSLWLADWLWLLKSNREVLVVFRSRRCSSLWPDHEHLRLLLLSTPLVLLWVFLLVFLFGWLQQRYFCLLRGTQ